MKNFKSLSPVLALAALFIAAVDPAFAAAGTTQSVSNLFDTINSAIKIAAPGIATCGFLFCGFKYFFRGASLEHLIAPASGSIIIAATPWLVDLFMG